MTMHLIKGANSLNHRKPKTKLTKKKLEELKQDHKQHNKNLKQQHRHQEMLSFDEYVDYRLGKKTKKKEFKEFVPPVHHYRRQEVKRIDSRSTSVAAKQEPKKYTGDVVKGIALMHKSNFVPVIDDEHAIDIARMRRG